MHSVIRAGFLRLAALAAETQNGPVCDSPLHKLRSMMMKVRTAEGTYGIMERRSLAPFERDKG
jgi:hypothetical protein